MAFEAAFPFIVGYVTLWVAWGEIVAAALPRLTPWTLQLRAQGTPAVRNQAHSDLRAATSDSAAPPGVQPGLSLCALISGCALAPVILLALASTWVLWIPKQTNEMLSLMTAPLLGVFVVRQLSRDD